MGRSLPALMSEGSSYEGRALAMALGGLPVLFCPESGQDLARSLGFPRSRHLGSDKKQSPKVGERSWQSRGTPDFGLCPLPAGKAQNIKITGLLSPPPSLPWYHWPLNLSVLPVPQSAAGGGLGAPWSYFSIIWGW